MIHVYVGTKAQFIKMAPVMHELDSRGLEYNFIDAGQHSGLTPELVREFGLKSPDVILRQGRQSIVSLMGAVLWSIQSLGQLLFNGKKTYERVFRGQAGICLIHGDTLTTLLSLVYAKRYGIRVAHVEAGLRSYSLRSPFPEELIRIVAMRYSDVLFAPSDWALENLRKMGYAGKAANAGANTIVDTLRFALQHGQAQERPDKPYVVATIHRFETILSRSRLMAVVALLERVARDRLVLFVLHDPTRRQLRALGLEQKLGRHNSIILMPLHPYPVFINLIAGADFVVTDGGSVQEETYFLNIPCLIMRSKTERIEGVGENACIAGFDPATVESFIGGLQRHKRFTGDASAHPSRTIVDHVMPWA
ncbi:MAG: UDP-N-acetylglucosamine 2-epimerase [Desulfobacterales bacterium]|nr:MAG: UDP-N-acetylglucosamine 2-epimerase [Desulfobacterales bacterium]